MHDYDIEEAFAAIEEELISSMIRNMKRHRIEEISEKKRWAMWQAMQLESLERYKKKNAKEFSSRFSDINDSIEAIIRQADKDGSMRQELEILQAIKGGFKGYSHASSTMQGEFFKLNERKLEALIKATRDDMEKAETAVLRMANDQYRKIIYNAQVYANTGAGTYEKAVDMATKDMLSSGLNCVEYKNGARHTLADYADMAIRTASKRAYLQGEGTKRQEWGIPTVIMNKRGNPCPKCLPFVGKVLIDDVWSGGPKNGKSPETGIQYPLMSRAITAGLYHPRCKDSHTTYFEGISTPSDDKYTRDELNQIVEKNHLEAKQQYAKRQEDKFGRIAKFSLDEENKKIYAARSEEWGDKKNWLHRLRKMWPDRDVETLPEFQKQLPEVKNTDARELFLQALERIEFGESQRKNSYFSSSDKTIYLSVSATADTVAHELFHEIDYTYGITKNGALKLQLKNDYHRLIRIADKRGESIEDMLYFKYPEVFEMGRHGVKLKEEYRGISDILNGMSSGKIRLGYRHEDSYWNREGMLEKESWAQYGRMLFQGDEKVLEFAEVLFPETTEEVLRILKEMIK